MLPITIPDTPATEMWNEETNEFVSVPARKGATIQLEHSLMSISKWESKWHKSYLSTKQKTVEEYLDYIRCMTLTKDVDPDIYQRLSEENFRQINNYIQDSMTATTVHSRNKKGPSMRIVTSEIIYSWMIDAEIPFSCEKWHLNRLLMLIQVRNEQANPGKKMSKKSIMKDNTALNAARRQKLRSKG